MNNNDIDKLLNDLNESPVPKPNPEVRKQTISKATEIFRQGFNESTLPIDEPADKTAEKPKSVWSKIMNFLSNPNENRTGYHAFGTIAVVVAVSSIALMAPALFDKPRSTLGTTVIDEDGVTVNLAEPESIITKDRGQTRTRNEQAIAASETAVKSKKVAVKRSATPSPSNDLATVNKEKNIHIAEEIAKNAPVAQASDAHIWEGTTSTWGVDQSIDGLRALRSEKKRELPVGSLSEEIIIATGNQSLTNSQAPAVERKRKSPQLAPLEQSSFAIADAITAAPIQTDREEFSDYKANSIKFVSEHPVSTFSVDVDTASYSLIRNQLNSGRLPKPQAVRVEELINYFDYNYPLPRKKSLPFSSSISVLNSPWNTDKKLVHIGIKGYEIAANKQPNSNIVFLLDVSGSMNQANKLPLVKQSINLLLDTLKPTDTVSIVVYAGAAGAVLEPTLVKEKTKILNAIRNLRASGSTAGGAGIRLAYQFAEQNFSKNAVNRIILATDGDFNVGEQSNEDLKTLVERKRESGVFLSVLGFGRGNYQDDMMQTLAQNGNGVAAYIDTLSEAKKVLVDQATSTLFTIAKDVKLQVEFNPATVSDYRLVGYETRTLKKEDFNNDKVDAGDIGAGHTVTAIYEITPRNARTQSIDTPRYTENQKIQTQEGDASEYGFLKIRYKLPDQSTSRLIKAPINIATNSDSTEAIFSVAVAGFGQLLANGKHIGKLTYDDVIKAAQNNIGNDPYGYRSEFIQLVRMAKIANP